MRHKIFTPEFFIVSTSGGASGGFGAARSELISVIRAWSSSVVKCGKGAALYLDIGTLGANRCDRM